MPDAECEPGAELGEGEEAVLGDLGVEPRPPQQGLGADVLLKEDISRAMND